MVIHKVTDPEFRKYGKVLTGIDVEIVCKIILNILLAPKQENHVGRPYINLGRPVIFAVMRHL